MNRFTASSMPSRSTTCALVRVVQRRQVDAPRRGCRARCRARSSSTAGTRGCSRPCGAGRCRGSTARGAGCAGPTAPNSSRKLNTRSLARAFSSSRRAPPNTAPNLFSLMPRSSVDGLQPVARGARAGVLDDAAGVDVVLHAAPRSAAGRTCSTVRSRNSMTSSKFSPVSTCITGNGTGAGQNALTARCSMTTESLPPENSSAGLSMVAATSRKMCTASASSFSRWVSSYATVIRPPERPHPGEPRWEC